MKIKFLSEAARRALSYGARFCLVLALGSTVSLHAQRKLSNPNASKEAVALYKYIQDMDGKKILSGQMWSNFSGDELVYIQTNTGKQPAIRGMDFISQSQNNAEVQHAIDWWKTGGIPTIMWHWAAPSKAEGFPNTMVAIDINRCFQAGTPEFNAFWSELKIKADLLQKLRDANIPVLWRPFHELNGGWFWWSKGGPAQFKQLWTTMYNYFVTDRGLNNLIWVLCYDGQPDGAWFPGNQFVDIAGADTYTTATTSQLDMFNHTDLATGGNTMPIAFHECGTPPNPDLCLKDGAMWSWWMEWHSSHLFALDKTYLSFLYHHPLIITKDQVPNIMAVYGTSTPPVSATGVSLTPATASTTTGGTVALTAAVAPSTATNKAVTWTSSASGVATVSAAGVVSGVTAGTATITVHTADGGFTATSAVTVTTASVRVTGVVLAPATASVAVGSTTTLTANVAPANATNKAITFTSSAPTVATVSATGVVSGVAAGTATITARTADGGFTATSAIMVTGGGNTTACANPTPVTLKFVKEGVGDFCYVTSGNISFINSWNMQLIEVNGVALTNVWSNSMPARINGNYYIHYVSTVPWSHLEINGTP